MTDGKPSSRLQALKAAGSVLERVDNWVNTLTGLGSIARDKVQSTSFQRRPHLNDETLEGLYHEDPIAARIVESVPQDAFRQGIGLSTTAELEPEDKAAAENDLQDALKALQAHKALQEGATWGNLFGGGIVLLGADDARRPEKPLQVDKVRELRFLTTMDKRDLVAATYYQDPRAPNFGQVETYRLQASSVGTSSSRQASGTIVHETRLLRFGGVLTSRRERQRLASWDHSVLHRVQDALRSYASDWASVSNMLTDSSQGVLKIRGFYELLAGGQKAQFQERLEAISLARFVGRIMPIDSEEEFTYQERSFAGLSDLMDRTTLRISAASDVPISKLFGRAPAGLSGDAAGANDQINWNNKVRATQVYEYGPQYDRLVRILAQALGLPKPQSWSVTWPSLWLMTPEQEATVRKTTAETDNIYLQAQVLDPDEVRARRFASGQGSLEPPEVELEADRDEPEPKSVTGPAAPPALPTATPESVTAPPSSPATPEALAAEEEAAMDTASAVRVDSPWADALPPVIAEDLRALRQLARTGAAPVVLRRLLSRISMNLGLGEADVLEAIAGSTPRWDSEVLRLDFLWPSASVTPVVASDLVAFETLVRVKAPQLLLRRLAARIGAALELTDEEVRAALESGDYQWIAAMPGVGLPELEGASG